MKRNLSYNGLSLLLATAALLSAVALAQAADQKPNILFIMGDDIGMWNIGAYHRGMMAEPLEDNLSFGEQMSVPGRRGFCLFGIALKSYCQPRQGNITLIPMPDVYEID